MIRTALPEQAELLAALHDRWRQDWPEFSHESPEGVRTAITDDGMVYLLLDERATVCFYPDPAHAYGFLDFPYANPDDAPALVQAALGHLAGRRVECPLPAEREREVQLLVEQGFAPGRRQRHMTLKDWPRRQALALPDGVEQAAVSHDEVETLHDLTFQSFTKPPGWRKDPGLLPTIGLRTAQGTVGYALIAHHGGAFWLWELAVHPDWRRKGLGRMLTLLALDALREAGAGEVQVSVNDDHDQRAPALYEGVGFQTTSLITRYVKELG